jgi:small subunit ribosomal protein S2
MPAEILLKDLLEAGCHFGHQSRRWHPKMKPYLFGVRDGVHIFDLAKTKEKLQEAVEFVHKTAANGGTIVFVGCKRQAAAIVKEEAVRAGMPFANQRWLGGTITNWEQIKRMLNRLKEYKEKQESGEFSKYTKKENLLISREVARLEKTIGGLTALKNLPDALLVVDVKNEAVAVAEAVKRHIPVVAIVDSNSNPEIVDFPIPANDDAVGSITFVMGKLTDAIKEGREAWEKKNKKAAEEAARAKEPQSEAAKEPVKKVAKKLVKKIQEKPKKKISKK